MNAQVFLICVIFVSSSSCRKGYGPGEQEWGHITVRPGAHLFFWMFYAEHVDKPEDAATLLWLPGGPGGSAIVGFSTIRDEWGFANIILLDNPVGVGFSYVDNETQLATTDEQIGIDTAEFFKQLYEQFPWIKKSPLYITGASYGGKIAVVSAQKLVEANLDIDLKGIIAWVPWISPEDEISNYPSYLRQLSLIDDEEYQELERQTEYLLNLTSEEKYDEAIATYAYIESFVENITAGVNIHNVLNKITLQKDDAKVNKNFMDLIVRKVLGIQPEVEFMEINNDVKNALFRDLLVPVTSIVEDLLNNTNATISVITGQLDAQVNAVGTETWLDELTWYETEVWSTAERKPIILEGEVVGYEKETDKLEHYTVVGVGHGMMFEKPRVTTGILKKILGQESPIIIN